MLNILSILTYAASLVGKDDRFIILDEEHVLDSKTGVKFHLYDDYFKLTHDDKLVAVKSDFTGKEQDAIFAIKVAIAGNETMEQKKALYQQKQAARRANLASLYENPIPTKTNEPVEEQNTVQYGG